MLLFFPYVVANVCVTADECRIFRQLNPLASAMNDDCHFFVGTIKNCVVHCPTECELPKLFSNVNFDFHYKPVDDSVENSSLSPSPDNCNTIALNLKTAALN